METQDVLFGIGAVCLTVFACAWMAVGAWPREWVEWRAEWGDRLAIEEMFKRTGLESDMDIHSYWANKKGEVTERDVLFMDPSARKTMRLYFEARGQDTPLLDVLVK